MIFNAEINYLEPCSQVESLERRLAALRQESPRERRLMASLAITLRDGVYSLGRYRYGRLGDAVSYARLQRAMRE